ncbi:hypothetical protein IKT18_00690 [Candidatus Saccharibacteria bacterium]|nr:hypothetical protein [Candidatus Saccharibacteria bacterium]
MNQITVNVNEPNTVDPAGTPDAGMLTIDHSGTAILIASIGINILIVIVSIMVRRRLRRYKAKKERRANSSGAGRNLSMVVSSFLLLFVAAIVFGALKTNDSHFSASAADDEDPNALSVTVDDVAINVELGDEPVYAMASSTVTIDAATAAGYTLSAYVENADLTQEGTSDKISSLAALEPATNLSDNTWGVALTSPEDQDSEVFVGLPTDADSPMLIKETTSATPAGDATTLYYATYVVPGLSYGTYTGATIQYIAIANVDTTRYLQNIADWRNDLEEDVVVEAVDSRDMKAYVVAKLKDGRIWMMQNLDLDLNSGTVYTNEDTDLGYNSVTGEYEEASWQPSYSTSSNGSDWINSTDKPVSYNLGDVYWNGDVSDWSDWDAYYYGCEWNSELGKLECDEELNPFNNYITSSGIPQYHLGNYYNWAAAIATNKSSDYVAGDIADQSICPAGWTLPSVDDYFDMWAEYGFTTHSINGDDKLWESPLYFVTSGYYDSGVLTYLGSDGGFWTPEGYADNNNQAWGVDYGVDGYLDSVYGYRDYGHSVRCVAR